MDDIDMDRLERELEGNGSESDSSLDLHTPFAYVISIPSAVAGSSPRFFSCGEQTCNAEGRAHISPFESYYGS